MTPHAATTVLRVGCSGCHADVVAEDTMVIRHDHTLTVFGGSVHGIMQRIERPYLGSDERTYCPECLAHVTLVQIVPLSESPVKPR